MPDPTSTQIAEVYGRVLKVEHVRDSDDFFTLGGTSLSAIELLDVIDKEFGVRLTPRVFYRATVVTELTHEVNARLADTGEGA
ncbi:phosphopantetheine-binding protein [Streptomyces sp. ITFR-6]|uniref:phosphopantetheine-binding protein n=1 Tax=Streptomyces sp. ITFR-6 TaxID=3075197 RepID=UPI00288A0A2D|nr:phosphopantetheine-binding protein [Streptomyces sp. ITFR-6]WNI32324.1 phosphopantetheine-binding protein [Streptomyces sp. ITFR-6]